MMMVLVLYVKIVIIAVSNAVISIVAVFAMLQIIEFIQLDHFVSVLEDILM